MSEKISVIATKVSGSIADWGKVRRIVPLFREHGFENVELYEEESHVDARVRARELVKEGRRLLISAGGSGTFNAVLEGCCDSGVSLDEIRLGFLRKGSADLIGKVLGMPDEIESAIQVFAQAIRSGCVVPCDVLAARDEGGSVPSRHFVGYGGAGIFGRIPHFTENRFMKWYKGVLGQVFGDLGPFTTGMTLALIEKLVKGPFGRERWRITVDDTAVTAGACHALIIVNGYLGPDLPFADDSLGSGCFHLFALRDLGIARLPGQAWRARTGLIMSDPERWGMEHHVIRDTLRIERSKGVAFPLNVDGSTLICHGTAIVRRVGSISLIAREPGWQETGMEGARSREAKTSAEDRSPAPVHEMGGTAPISRAEL